MKIFLPFFVLLILISIGCNRHEDLNPADRDSILENRSISNSFVKLSSIDLGEAGAAEISSFDPISKKLFVVNNTSNNNRIDVVNVADPSKPSLVSTIIIADLGGLVNSLDVSNGMLAAAIEAKDKVSSGKVAIFNTQDLRLVKLVSVGSLPDMVSFTPDGKFILTADEGEPNADYSKDPLGTVSIIDVEHNYQVITLDFSHFKSQYQNLKEKGLRIFGPKASFGQDIEPEFITISPDSRFAWVTLQENNAIAKVDIRSKVITDLFPLGFKNYYKEVNALDASDRDGGIKMDRFALKGIYEPDGLALLDHNGNYYLYTANEGDAREYSSYVENVRAGAGSYKMDSISIPLRAILKGNDKLGRLNVTNALGDKDGDGDFDEIYTHGARSFSIWNARSGEFIYDSKNEIDKIMIELGKYPDSRSDDKGSEPESIIIGNVGGTNLLFVGLERADAVMVYDLTNPLQPVYLQTLNTGIAPEGLIFVTADKSPNGKNLIIVSCEGDGQVLIFSE